MGGNSLGDSISPSLPVLLPQNLQWDIYIYTHTVGYTHTLKKHIQKHQPLENIQTFIQPPTNPLQSNPPQKVRVCLGS